MKDEIKEIKIKTIGQLLDYVETKQKAKELIDYITNLQEENERLKTQLNCKEYFSATMPENTEFVILTKNNYDRQQKDIQLDLIDYKSRIENAINYIKVQQKIFRDYDIVIENQLKNLIEILQGGGKDE